MQSAEIRIGTRGSPLALAQAEEAAPASRQPAWRPTAIEVVPIRTTGDRITDRSLIEAGGKGLFTKEIDEALLAGAVDIAVHSAKDMPTRLPDGIVVAACLKREDVRDAFLSPKAGAGSPICQAGAVLGTSSLRRKAMALSARPDLDVVDMRGNVETRMRKLAEGEADATLLALRRPAPSRARRSRRPASSSRRMAAGGRPGNDRHRGARRRRCRRARACRRRSTIATLRSRSPPSAPFSPCSTARAGRRSAGLRGSNGGSLDFRGIIVKPDGSEAHETEKRGIDRRGDDDRERGRCRASSRLAAVASSTSDPCVSW